MPNIKDQSGVLLLLSIVMTTVILTAALIMSTLIIREIRVSQISDKGQIALFAAESASEDAVFQLLQLGVDPVALDGASGSFSTGATWSRSVSNETNEFVVDYIPPNRSEVINLYNRTKANHRAEVSSLSLSWSSGTLLAIDASVWDGSTLSALSPLQTLPCAAGSCSASVPLDPTKGYALVFTAEGTAITDLIISLAPANNLVETAVTVKVVGEYRGAEQALEIILPEPPPWESTPEAPEVSLTCGDGVLDTGEDCESALTPTQACTTIEGYAGDQTCNATMCSWDACVSSENCGDGIVNGTEQCEPPGTATCDASCQDVAVSVCGNDVIEAGEACDNGLNNSDTIADACRTDCSVAICGDNVVDTGEECDGSSYCDVACLVQEWSLVANYAFSNTVLAAIDGTIFAADNTGKMFKTSDNGISWIQTGVLSGATYVRSSFIASDGAIFVGTQPNGDVFRSTNNGASWSATANISGATDIRSFAQDSSGTIYVGTYPYAKVFKSSNNGASWVATPPLESSLSVSSITHALEVTSNGDVYAGIYDFYFGAVLYKSTNSGGSWVVNKSFSATGVNKLIETSDGDLYAATYGPGKVFKSVDNGSSWNEVGTLNVLSVYDMIEISSGEIYISTGSLSLGDVYLLDGGTWVPSPNIYAGLKNVFSLAEGNDGSLFVGSDDGVFKLAP